MQYSTIQDYRISRFGMGTKSMPTEDSARVIRLDQDAATALADQATAAGVNYFDTSYSNHKGEAEAFLGAYRQAHPDTEMHVASSFFEMIDPRFDYVFQKQLKKLGTDCIDFYSVEGVNNLTRMKDIDSGAVDFLFEQKEAGKIGLLGFSSGLDAKNLKAHLAERPWDFVRMRINYYDWFEKGVREQYETAAEAGIPIFAHAPLHVGTSSNLKPGALALLKEQDAQRSSVDWALRFVKSLEAVTCVTCNVHSPADLEEDAAVFTDDAILSASEIDLLAQVAAEQKKVHRN